MLKLLGMGLFGLALGLLVSLVAPWNGRIAHVSLDNFNVDKDGNVICSIWSGTRLP